MNTTGILGPGSPMLTAEVKQIQVLKNILCESDEIFGTETFFFESEILVKKMLNCLDSKYVNSWKIKSYLCPDILQHTKGTIYSRTVTVVYGDIIPALSTDSDTFILLLAVPSTVFLTGPLAHCFCYRFLIRTLHLCEETNQHNKHIFSSASYIMMSVETGTVWACKNSTTITQTTLF